MNKYEQIEEMVKDIYYSEEDFWCSCFATDKEECDSCPDEHSLNCKAYHIAKSLYTLGYRKASEIFEEIINLANEVYSSVQYGCYSYGMTKYTDSPSAQRQCGKLEGVKYLGDRIAELKKKYEVNK